MTVSREEYEKLYFIGRCPSCAPGLVTEAFEKFHTFLRERDIGSWCSLVKCESPGVSFRALYTGTGPGHVHRDMAPHNSVHPLARMGRHTRQVIRSHRHHRRLFCSRWLPTKESR